MTTVRELIEIVDNESAMSDKAKDAFKKLVYFLALTEANSNFLANIVKRSQKILWLGAFSKNPPARQLFSEHNKFPEPANMS